MAQSSTILPGATSPNFTLTATDNRKISFADFPTAKGFIVIFISNTCPYSKAYEQRIIDLNHKYAPLQFPLLAINSNDPGLSRGDNFINMKARAKQRRYSFPYLADPDQRVADLFGAKSTPHVFVVAKNDSGFQVEYTGTIDNDLQQKKPDRVDYVSAAVDALLHNSKPTIPVTHAVSCSITRKKKD